MKTCKICLIERPHSEFYVRPSAKDGMSNECRPCARARTLKWQLENPERKRANMARFTEAHRETERERLAKYHAEHPEANRAAVARYVETHKEQRKEDHLRWRTANPEKLAENNRLYALANPDSIRAKLVRRRAKIAAAPANDFTAEQWAAKKDYYNNRCAYCMAQEPLQIEHMIPIARGGSNTDDNIVPACGPCNRRKWTSTPLEFLIASS